MGAAGAALGTTLAQTLSVMISLLMTKKQKLGIKLCKQDFIPSRAVLSEILKIGIPVAIQDGCIQIAFIIITVIANSRGLNDAAAVGIVEKVPSSSCHLRCLQPSLHLPHKISVPASMTVHRRR